jgi:hypothetical protein
MKYVGNKFSLSILRYRYNLLLLDFVHRVTDIKTAHCYVSEAGSASVFREEAPPLLDPLDPIILSHCIPITATLTSVDTKKFVSVCSTILSLFKTDFWTQYSDSHVAEGHGEHVYSVQSAW